MQSEYAVLVEFKKGKDREDKQAMIDSFSRLSDDDKAEVVSHIDEYSVDEIEAKLAVICVRNKLNMSE
jgi:cytochrome c553